jgi:hypothetical protein
MVERILNTSNAPADLWMCALEYACFIINHTAVEWLGWCTPTELLLGYTPDITVLLQFYFYEPVYYQELDGKFPQDPKECLGRFVGIAETVGNAITFKILTQKRKIVYRLVVCSATKPGIYQNFRANAKAPLLCPKEPNAEVDTGKEKVPVVIRKALLDKELGQEEVVEEMKESSADPVVPETITEEDDNEGQESTPEGSNEEGESVDPKTLQRICSAMEHIINKDGRHPTLNAEHLLARTFITNPDFIGIQKRAKIKDIEATGEKALDGKQPPFKFQYKVGDKRFEEIVTYNRMLEWVEQDQDKDYFFWIVGIEDHKRIRGKWYVLIRWASGLTSWKLLATTKADDPVTVAMYAKCNNLLDTDGWGGLKKLARNTMMLGRMVNQAWLKNFRNQPVYKYGRQVPRNHAKAVMIDEKNRNTDWQDAGDLEISRLMEYKSFESLGVGAPIPEGYKKIPCHFVYDLKHTGKCKGRLVAVGHRTDTPTDLIYSGVVSLQGVRIVTLLAELNGLECWKKLIHGGWCAIISLRSPEYPGLGDVRMSRKVPAGVFSSWISRLCTTLKAGKLSSVV